MRKIILPVAALAAVSVPAAAQDTGDVGIDTAPMAEMAEQLRDPERQRELSMMLETMTQVLLDVPIAPLAKAAADMAGEKAEDIDPDLTLRQMTPDAEFVTGEIARNVPRMMEMMGSMSEGLAAMTPALKQMAERMKDAFPARD
ncbi:MAG: hypothetical protein R3E14_05070 [Erythrobacter sp.]